MIVVGISAFSHDSSVTILKNNRILFSAHEERYSRKKFDSSFPYRALQDGMRFCGLFPEEVSRVGFFENPNLKRRRQKNMGFSAVHLSLTQASVSQLIRSFFGNHVLIDFHRHHHSHAASSFFVSGFQSAANLTIDAVGEAQTSSLGQFVDHRYEELAAWPFPHSLGLLYSAVTSFLGFDVNSDEYKVMGLAAYGQPTFYKKLRELVELKGLNFNLQTGLFADFESHRLDTNEFAEFLQLSRRLPRAEFEKSHRDLAASIQKLLQECVVHYARKIQETTKLSYLCLSGGVALNCSAVAEIRKAKIFKDLFVQPASGDAGTSMGAAFLSLVQSGFKFKNERLKNCALGSDLDLYVDLKKWGYTFKSNRERSEKVAKLLSKGKICGWVQGRAEWGPRALGQRSILADPRAAKMKSIVNRKIKLRENFRPFAPVVCDVDAKLYFDTPDKESYMTEIYPVKVDNLRAVTHVDKTARAQILSRSQNSGLYDLIQAFRRETGVAVLLNTSFNQSGEPLVNSVDNAMKTFLKAKLDFLVLDNVIIQRSEILRKLKKLKIDNKVTEKQNLLYTF